MPIVGRATWLAGLKGPMLEEPSTGAVRPRLHVLDRQRCDQLLAQEYLGRVAFLWDGEPEILPVNYRYDGSGIVFQTAAGTKLAAASAGGLFAFEIDGVDDTYHRGWSVVVRGQAQIVDDDLDLGGAPPLRSWLGDTTATVRISAERVTGRRVG